MGNFSENDMDDRSEEMGLSEKAQNEFSSDLEKSKSLPSWIKFLGLFIIWSSTILVIRSYSTTGYQDIQNLQRGITSDDDNFDQFNNISQKLIFGGENNLTKGLNAEETLFALGYENEEENSFLKLFEQFPNEFGFYIEHAFSQKELPTDFFQMVEENDPDNSFYYYYAAALEFEKAFERKLLPVNQRSKKGKSHYFEVINEIALAEGERLYQLALLKEQFKLPNIDLAYRRVHTLNSPDDFSENVYFLNRVFLTKIQHGFPLFLSHYVQYKLDSFEPEQEDKIKQFLIDGYDTLLKVQKEDRTIINILVSNHLFSILNDNFLSFLDTQELDKTNSFYSVSSDLESFQNESFTNKRTSRFDLYKYDNSSFKWLLPSDENYPTKAELLSHYKSLYYSNEKGSIADISVKAIYLFLTLTLLSLAFCRKSKTNNKRVIYKGLAKTLLLSVCFSVVIPLLGSKFLILALMRNGFEELISLSYMIFTLSSFSFLLASVTGIILALEWHYQKINKKQFSFKVTIFSYTSFLLINFSNLLLFTVDNEYVAVIFFIFFSAGIIGLLYKLTVFFKHRDNKDFNSLIFHQFPVCGSLTLLIFVISYLPLISSKEHEWFAKDTLMQIDYENQSGTKLEGRAVKALKSENTELSQSLLNALKEP